MSSPQNRLEARMVWSQERSHVSAVYVTAHQVAARPTLPPSPQTHSGCDVFTTRWGEAVSAAGQEQAPCLCLCLCLRSVPSRLVSSPPLPLRRLAIPYFFPFIGKVCAGPGGLPWVTEACGARPRPRGRGRRRGGVSAARRGHSGESDPRVQPGAPRPQRGARRHDGQVRRATREPGGGLGCASLHRTEPVGSSSFSPWITPWRAWWEGSGENALLLWGLRRAGHVPPGRATAELLRCAWTLHGDTAEGRAEAERGGSSWSCELCLRSRLRSHGVSRSGSLCPGCSAPLPRRALLADLHATPLPTDWLSSSSSCPWS